MGRMMEALKQTPPRRCPPADESATLRPFLPGRKHASEEAGEEMPFIEVGGPAHRLVGSPAVLAGAAPPQPAAAPANAVPAGPRLQPLPVPSPAAPPLARPSVVFQPLSALGKSAVLAPAQRFAPELIAFHQPGHPLSEDYRALLASLIAQLPAVRIQVLLFTAATPGVSTTTVLLNMAITAARHGQVQVAVIDANFQRPAVAERLGLPAAPGLRDVLAGNVSLPRALLETGQPNLQALTAGDIGPTSEVRFSREALRPVLRQLRDRFELVLVDAPCWTSQPELIALGSACDAVYLVLESRQTGTAEVNHLIEAIPEQGCQLRGCLLTQR